MSGIRDFIKEQDLYASPVVLSYRGKRGFNTMLGGIGSILITVMLLAFFSYDLYEKIVYPQYRQISY